MVYAKVAGWSAVFVLGVVVCLDLGTPTAGTRSTAGKSSSGANAAIGASDAFGDGTPDFLRLTSSADQAAFRRWSTLLAEFAAASESNTQVKSEVTDCSALLRFAYREALRAHDGRWYADIGFGAGPALPDVAKYQYPHTPLGAALFRVREGAYTQTDASDGSFAQFADAKTLMRLNAHLVSRDVAAAQPGDLLFYRQLEQNSPFHSMIFLGRRQLAPDAANDWVAYHTGEIAGGPGEMRVVRLAHLRQHKDVRWRPFPHNSNFLGVFRWNILRGSH